MDYNKLPGYGKDDWIKYSFNRSYDNPYPVNDFECFLRPEYSSKIVDIDVAAERVANDIYKTYKSKLYLAMSGGVDSEYIADILLKNNIPFIPIIFKLESHNQIDIWWAFRWCEQHKIKPTVIECNVKTYLKDYIKLAQKYCSRMTAGAVSIEHIANYVREKGGSLITGAAFNELFIPDPIMWEEEFDETLKDSKGKTKRGYVQSEADMIKAMLVPDMPFTFLNWNAEITLSYVGQRQPDDTTEEYRFRLFRCSPRPKLALPVSKSIIRDFENKNYRRLISNLGTTQSYFIGTEEEIKNILLNGI